ncbi:replication initiation protein (plasmid) [Acinetobacter baumannii]
MTEATQKQDKKYPISTMAIQNKVTECFKSMSVDEKRLLIMASPMARNMDATEQDAILIRADEFARECGIKVNSAYKQIADASRKLIDRSFSYTNEKGKKVHSNWVIDATYEDAGINVRFTGIVLVMLKILDKQNPYTKYKKEIVLKLKKDYSIDFYHLAKKYQQQANFELSLDDMFQEFGLPDSYRDISNLKKRVLKNSIDEINSNTDVTLTYTPIKKGRSIVGYRFTVKEKRQPKIEHEQHEQKGRDKNTIDMFCNLNDAQINKYSSILSKISDISDLSTFPDYSTFAQWIANILRDPKSVREVTAKRIFTALHQYTDFKG